MSLDTGQREGFGPLGAESVAAMAAGDPDLRRFLITLWRVKGWLLLLAALGLGLAQLYLSTVVPLYTARARVLWEVESEKVVDLTPVTPGLGSDLAALASQIEVIRSGRLMGRVVDALDLGADPVFNEALRPAAPWRQWLAPHAVLDWLRHDLAGLPRPALVAETPEALRQRMIDQLGMMVSPSWLDGTYVLDIQATTADPAKSALLANKVAELYILDQLQTKFDATRQATTWLTDRVEELRTALEAAENAVENFSSDSALVSEEAMAALSRQVKDMRDRADGLAADLAAAQTALTEARAARARGDLAAGAAALVDLALGRLIADAGALPGPDAQARIDLAYDRALERQALTRDRLRGQEDQVRASIADLDARLADQGKSLVALRQLQREADASRLIYEFFLGRLKETSVQEGIQRPDARVLTAAVVPLMPSAPNRLAIYGIGGAAGLLLGLMVMLLVERMNISFRSAEEIERRTGLAVIGTIPIAPVARRRAFLGYITQKPTSSVAEAIRNLRTSILLANVDQPPQVIMMTSAVPGEGKTSICIALAQISRALGKRVLLVECDIRRRTFRNYFDLQGTEGLLSVLSGARGFEEVVHIDPASGLAVLPGEESAANAADVFASQRFADFLAEMRGQFDFIFVDTPPVLAVPDARVIAKNCDAVLFAVRWNDTARDTVVEGLRVFAQVNIKIAGLVLSRVNQARMARYGYGGYGYYKATAKYYHN